MISYEANSPIKLGQIMRQPTTNCNSNESYIVRGPRARILEDLTLSAIKFLSYTLFYHMSLVYGMPYWTS